MTRRTSRFGFSGRRFGAWLWTIRGRRRLRRGEVQGAIQAFHTALARRPGRFRTLIDLSIAHLIARNVPQAQASLGQARRSDPARFAERAPRLLGRWGFELPRIQTPPRPEPVVQTAGVRHRTVTAHSLPFGDCRDLDEYARFRAMPPISQAEIDGLDWDRVLGDLLEE